MRSSPPVGRELEAIADSIVHYIVGRVKKERENPLQRFLNLGPEISLTAINPRGSRHPLLQQILIQVPLFDILQQSQLFYRSITFEQGMHPRWLSGKEPPAKAGDVGLIPGLARSPGGANDNSGILA